MASTLGVFMSKLLISALALTLMAAAPEKTTLGTRKNPIKFMMVPSSDAGKILVEKHM